MSCDIYWRTASITAATGRRAGTKGATAGMTRTATGTAFLRTGTTFFLRKFFWSGAVAIKSTQVEEDEEKSICQSFL